VALEYLAQEWVVHVSLAYMTLGMVLASLARWWALAQASLTQAGELTLAQAFQNKQRTNSHYMTIFCSDLHSPHMFAHKIYNHIASWGLPSNTIFE